VVALAAEHRDDHDLGARRNGVDVLDDLEAAPLGQPEGDQGDVGTQGRDGVDGAARIGELGNQRQRAVELQVLAKALAMGRIVLDDDHRHRHDVRAGALAFDGFGATGPV